MNKLVKQIYKDTIWYFKEISKHYRNSTECNKCWKWLLKAIKELRLKPKSDEFSKTSRLAKEEYGNIMFDIPANNKELDGVILQAHYDMVVVGDDIDFIKKNGIIIQQSGIFKSKKFHSKKYETSLGADDGIGVAIILALAKNRDTFQHGNIRVIFSCDEEVSWGGSESSKIKQWLIYDKLINLDCSEHNKARIGCFEACQTDFHKKIKTTLYDDEKNIFRIKVWDLIGGHSAGANNKQANAVKLIFMFASKIEDIQLISYDNLGNVKTNAIANSGELVFATAKDLFELENIFVQLNIRKQNPDEKYFKHKIDKVRMFNKKCISNKDSIEITKFINELDFGEVKTFKEGKPELTANISPLISFDCNKDNAIKLTTFNRTSNPKLIKALNLKVKKQAKKMNWRIERITIDPIWKEKKNSKLQQIFKQAADMANNKIIFETTPAWLEPAEYIQKKPKLDMISIGPKSKGCHTRKETLYIKTIPTVLEEMICTFELLKKEV